MADTEGGPQMPDDDPDAGLANDLAELGEVVQSRSESRADTLSIVESALARPVTPDTWGDLSEALTAYYGPVGSHVMTWVLESPVDRLPMTRPYASKEVSNLLDTIVARFGRGIDAAMQASGQIPDDWKLISRHVLSYRGEDRYVVRLEITKYNQEEILLELSPNSLISFCTYLLGYLDLIGDATVFNQELVTNLSQTVETLARTVSEAAKAAQAPAADGEIAALTEK